MIRDAEHRDVIEMVRLGAAMHAESNFAPLKYSSARVATVMHYMIDHPEACMVAVYEHEKEIVGVMAAQLQQGWFCEDYMASDFALYVTPKARHSAIAFQLVATFKAWALAHGAKQVRAATGSGSVGQAANAIYEHLGFKPAGACFVLDAAAAEEQPVAA